MDHSYHRTKEIRHIRAQLSFVVATVFLAQLALFLPCRGSYSFIGVGWSKPTLRKPTFDERPLVSCGERMANTCSECASDDEDRDLCMGECSWDEKASECTEDSTVSHLLLGRQARKDLLSRYPFQPVLDQRGRFVNIVLVKSAFTDEEDRAAFEKYRNDTLFLGIMSYETFPLPSSSQYSSLHYPPDEYITQFKGWLNMYRRPDSIFPPEIKTILMSQSDFGLPTIDYPREVDEARHRKRFDFVYVMSGGGSALNENCTGWGPYTKNWTFAKEALDVMCGDLNLTGAILASRRGDTWDAPPCDIPASCRGKVLQTPFLWHGDAFDYIRQSRVLFVPNVYDASPRVITQALTFNVPILVNEHIIGGWKYVNNMTGEFFHDLSDLRTSYGELKSRLDIYQPRQYVTSTYGDDISGRQFKVFVEENFAEHATLPGDTSHLIPSMMM